MQETRYFYLNSSKKPVGSFLPSQLREKLAMGEISPEQLVAAVGGSEWQPLRVVFPEMVEATEPAEQAQAAQLDEPQGSPPAKVCPHCYTEQAMESDAMLLRCPRCDQEVAPDPNSTLWEHFLSSMRRYVCFRGRATRKEYWSFVLFQALISLPFSALLTMANMPRQMQLQASGQDSMDLKSIAYPPFWEMSGWEQIALAGSMLMGLFFLLPCLGVTVRRFHDVGWRGVIPMVSAIMQQYTAWALIFPMIFVFPWATFTTLTTALNLVILVVAFMDSKRGNNKFGPSSKYPR